MTLKTFNQQADEIRVCIACNQACIGHYALGAPISCIQFPESGRELQYGERSAASVSRDVLVVGGGPVVVGGGPVEK